MRKSFALAAGLAVAVSGGIGVLTATSAAAANGVGQGTPGSACTITVTETISLVRVKVNYPGTVSTGYPISYCTPNTPIANVNALGPICNYVARSGLVYGSCPN